MSDSCEASSLDLSSSFCRLESGSRRCPFYTALWDHTRTEMQRSSNLLHNTRSVLLLNHIFSNDSHHCCLPSLIQTQISCRSSRQRRS